MERSPVSARSLLAALPLFTAVGEKTLQRLAKGTRELYAPKGTLIFTPGESPTGLYAVVSGLVKIAVPTAPGREKVVGLLGDGSTFGLSALFAKEPYIVSAGAVRDSVLAHISAAHVLSAMKTDPVFSGEIAARLSRRLRELLAELRSSTAESGTQRTVTFLLHEVPASASNGSATITLPAKKRIIASRLALTGEHFSRILHELAAARLIAVEGPKVTIPDVKRLRDYAASSQL